MTLTAPNCPVAESLPGEVQAPGARRPGRPRREVELTFDPPWDRSGCRRRSGFVGSDISEVQRRKNTGSAA